MPRLGSDARRTSQIRRPIEARRTGRSGSPLCALDPRRNLDPLRNEDASELVVYHLALRPHREV
jgi:hypothetical protein